MKTHGQPPEDTFHVMVGPCKLFMGDHGGGGPGVEMGVGCLRGDLVMNG